MNVQHEPEYDGAQANASVRRTAIDAVKSSVLAPEQTQKESGKRVLRDRDTLLLPLIVIFAALVRLAFLTQNMRYDESKTFNAFVDQAPEELFHLSHMNNHMFHSLLVWFSTLFVGSEPWALRLPAFIAGILMIPLTWRLCRELSNGTGGTLSTLGVSVFPFLVLFSTNARGYTILTCFALALATDILRVVKSSQPAPTIRIALLTSFGLWTNPSMLYPVAGLWLWLFFELFAKDRSLTKVVRDYAVPLGLQTTLLTFMLYSPALLRENGSKEVFANPVTASLPTTSFVDGIGEHFSKVYRHIVRDIPDPMRKGVIVLFLIGAIRLFLNTRQPGSALLLSMLLGTGGLFILKRSFPFTRNWMFLVPIVLIHADIGWSWLVRRLSGASQSVLLSGLVLLPGVYLGYDLVQRDRIATYNDTGRFPEVIEVADFLAGELRPDDNLVAQVPHCETLTYYLGRHSLAPKIQRVPDSRARNLVVVRKGNKHNRQISGLEPVFQIGETTVYVKRAARENASTM